MSIQTYEVRCEICGRKQVDPAFPEFGPVPTPLVVTYATEAEADADTHVRFHFAEIFVCTSYEEAQA